jgi:hypothetical protein
MWAKRTVEHRLSPIALRRSIEADQIITDDDLRQRTGNSSGIPVLQAVALPFTRWSRSIGGLDGVAKLKRDDQIAILQELTPIVEFALKLREQAFPDETGGGRIKLLQRGRRLTLPSPPPRETGA